MSTGRRFRGDRGTALVTAVVLLFAFTAAGVIVLARDYDERITTRATAQAIAFQAARVGAQQVAVASLRDAGQVRLDRDAAVQRADAAARDLLAEHGVTGDVEVSVAGDRVTVVVALADVLVGGVVGRGRTVVRAEGSARPVSG